MKSASTDVKQDKLTTKVTPGLSPSTENVEETNAGKKPGWKRVAIAEEEESQGNPKNSLKIRIESLPEC